MHSQRTKQSARTPSAFPKHQVIASSYYVLRTKTMNTQRSTNSLASLFAFYHHALRAAPREDSSTR